jgi:pimeloyl-ACP methyl ester carboxylesterase
MRDGEAVLLVKGILVNSPSFPEGPGSVSAAPHLPDGFAGTFTSRYVEAGGLRQHVVTGGDGPPLLLVHGWPQTWYAWRLVMPALARGFSVVVPDQRGCGLSGKPGDGYDTGTLAADLAALMDALGHRRFAVAGHDTGMWIGYALAADHPGRVARLAVAETPLPGVSDARPAGHDIQSQGRHCHETTMAGARRAASGLGSATHRGRAAFFRRRDAMAQFAATHACGAAREGGPG